MSEVLARSWPVVAALVLLLGLSAFFSAAETAVFTLGPSDPRAVGGRRGRLLRRLLDRRATLLVTVLLGNLVVNILYFNLGALLSFRLGEAEAVKASAVLPVLVLVAIVVLAEIVPKTAAVARARRVALLAGRPLLLLERVLFLPRVALGAVAELVGRLLLGSRREEGEVTPEELENLLELAAREGQIARDEAERLQSLLLLSRMAVREIMVPRVSIVGFRLEEGRERLLELVREHRLNKIVVYRESLDRVEGFLDVKEVLSRPGVELGKMVRSVECVPAMAQVAQVMDRFLQQGARLMVVVDEYGGTEGLLTREDLVEAVLGDLADDSDTEPPVVSLGPGRYNVDGGLRLRRWWQTTRPRASDLPVVTVGGLVTALLDRLPREGDEVTLGGATFKVVSMRGRRPHRIEVHLGGHRDAAP